MARSQPLGVTKEVVATADHHHHHSAGSTNGFGRAVAVTLLLILAKALGAWWGHSLALGADAAHSLGDVGALGLAWYADRQRHRPPAAHFTFGWGRLEVLAGLANALLLWVLAGALGWDALQHWRQPAANAGIMAIAAGISLVANGALAWGFRDPQDFNRRSTLWHLATDSAGSFGVLLAAAVLWRTGWTPVNAVVTLIIAALMVWGGWGVVRDTVRVLLEAAPASLPLAEIEAKMAAVSGVDQVHDLHVWTVSSEAPALACHVTLTPSAPPPQDVLCELHEVLEPYGITHSTIQIETEAEAHPHPPW